MGLEQLLTPKTEGKLEIKKTSKIKTTNLKNEKISKKEGNSLFNEILKTIQKKKINPKQNNAKTINLKSKNTDKAQKKILKKTNKNLSTVSNDIKLQTSKSNKKVDNDTNKNPLSDKTKIKSLQKDIKKEVANIDNLKIKNTKEDSFTLNSLFDKIKTKTLQKKEKIKNIAIDKKDQIEKNKNVESKKNVPIITTNLEKLKKIKKIDEKDENFNSVKTLVGLNEVITKTNNKISENKNIKNEKKSKITSKKIVKNNSLLDNLLNKAKNSKPNNIILNNKNEVIKKQFDSVKKVEKEVLKESILHQTKQEIIENKSIDSVVKGAKKLNLNIESIEIQKDKKKNKNRKEFKDKKNLNELFETSKSLNKAFLNKQIIDRQVDNKTSILQEVKTLPINTKLDSSEKIVQNEQPKSNQNIQEVGITVNKTLVEQFHIKIINAKQKMASLMSDIARSIYANYKPPVTSFRIKLNPVNLGQISVLIRTQKHTNNNSLEINLGISKQQTHEVLIEHKHLLQQSLNKNFNNSEISLNMSFSSDTGSSFNEYQHNQNHQNNKKNNGIENNNIEDENITYA